MKAAWVDLSLSSILLHYLDAIVYPNLPGWLVTSAGVAICALNLGIYCWRFRYFRRDIEPADSNAPSSSQCKHYIDIRFYLDRLPIQ